ncbi:MAG: GNAT family N-acetyltransferase [Pyrinomonadaceae bacterium]
MNNAFGEITYTVRPDVSNELLNELFAASWPNNSDPEVEQSQSRDFEPVLSRSLTFVCAFAGGRLVGFVYLAWDGGRHAFLLDTTVHPEFRNRGIGIELCTRVVRVAKERGLDWVHVDFESHLAEFYAKCGFQSTAAGLVRLFREDLGQGS